MTTVAQRRAWSRKYEGTREKAGNWNIFTNWLRSKGFRRVSGEYWCADFQACGDIQTGLDTPPGTLTASTLINAAAYKRAGRWGTNPRLGAKGFFYSPADGRIGHEGEVVAFTANTVTISAGNTSGGGSRNGDRVATKVFRRHATTGFRLVGYGYPYFTQPKPAPKPKPGHGNLNRLLQKGNKGGDVARVQRLVGVKADGEFGPNTDKAVRAWQHRHHLDDDGQFGRLSCRAAGWTWKGKKA
jgi:peptidoglycan hydrolase-like protein with peptidoglycan-binding domain